MEVFLPSCGSEPDPPLEFCRFFWPTILHLNPDCPVQTCEKKATERACPNERKFWTRRTQNQRWHLWYISGANVLVTHRCFSTILQIGTRVTHESGTANLRDPIYLNFFLFSIQLRYSSNLPASWHFVFSADVVASFLEDLPVAGWLWLKQTSLADSNCGFSGTDCIGGATNTRFLWADSPHSDTPNLYSLLFRKSRCLYSFNWSWMYSSSFLSVSNNQGRPKLEFCDVSRGFFSAPKSSSLISLGKEDCLMMSSWGAMLFNHQTRQLSMDKGSWARSFTETHFWLVNYRPHFKLTSSFWPEVVRCRPVSGGWYKNAWLM